MLSWGRQVAVPLEVWRGLPPLVDDDPGGVRFKPIREPGEDEGHDGGGLPAGLGECAEHGRAEVLEAESVARALEPGQVGEGGVQHRLDDASALLVEVEKFQEALRLLKQKLQAPDDTAD